MRSRQRTNLKNGSAISGLNGGGGDKNVTNGTASSVKDSGAVSSSKGGSSSSCYVSLACSIGSIGIACGSLLQLNSISERISLQRGLFITSLGFIYFISITDFFNRYLLETKQGIKLRRKYRLMVSDVMDITNKIVSAIQAAFSCLAGAIVCKSSCTRSFLYASHFVMEAYAWFGTAYFMYDIWSMYKVHTHKIADKLKLGNKKITTSNSLTTNKLNQNNLISSNNKNNNGLVYDKTNSTTILNNKNNIEKSMNNNHNNTKYYQSNEIIDYNYDRNLVKNERWDFLKYILKHPLMIMHHIFIGTFGLIVITYLRGGFGDCVYSFIYLMEFSTPFVSLRSILSTMGLKDTKTYILNGLMMLATFFICRILMWPYVLYGYSEAINRPFLQAIMGLPRGCKISILILFLPQIYWFSLMTKGAIKVLFAIKPPNSNGKSSSSISSSSNNKIALNSGIGENNLKRSVSPAKELSTPQNVVQQGRSLL